MKILCIVPPYIPSYFNAGHHLPVFQVAAYLRKAIHGVQVTACDFGAVNSTWRDVCELLVKRFDLIAVLNDFDAIDGFERFVSYAREISPDARLLTFGRGSKQVPGLFERYGFDAIVTSGDYEAGAAGYISFLRGSARPNGVSLRDDGYSAAPPGRFLEAADWALPEIDEIPYEAYDRLYANDLAKFCGIPARRELVVPVARGCPVGCKFCDVPSQQGLKERRVDVETVIRYIESCLARQPFEYVSFYAPTFTLKRSWVLELCGAMQERLPSLRWKCVTTLAHLDHDLLRAMGRAGCVRVGIGIETFGDGAAKLLPKLKRGAASMLDHIADVCTKVGIEINCFLMVGMPDERIKDAARTVNALIARGFRVRPTVFTPYGLMSDALEAKGFAEFNRQLLLHGSWTTEERAAAYDVLYANAQDKPTQVVERIPKRRPAE